MKKNLRNILALSLGLMTTVAFAQDWNVDSRTRIDMSGDNDKMSTDQRVTLGATVGGSDWGIHVSSDVNYTLGADTEKSMRIYEAYASADLMGYASVTAGRQALNYGSGALLSSNDWAAERTTWEGMTFGLNLDAADVTIGYHSQNSGAEGEDDAGNMWINAGGEFSGWNVNVLYMQDEGMEDNATGIDISGDLAGASVSASMNQDFNGGDMTMLGATYSVNDDMNVVGSYTTYGEEGFYMPGTNMDGSWMTTGGVGYLGANDENMSLGLTYNMGSINLGATMHQITNSENDDYERDVMEISLGYSLGDNAGLSLKYATDATGDADEDKYMWLTLNVGL
ncbi:porin [Flavobacteriales bacterium]|nr:porin [Flavobacteriales bacterium]